MFENLFNSRKPKGSKRRDPLEYSRKMLQQQRETAARSQKQFNESHARFLRNLQQQRQRQRWLDAIIEQRESQQQQQQQQQRKRMEESQAEARQRQQKLMEQWRQPIRTPEPFRYKPPASFELPKPQPQWDPRIPPKSNLGLGETVFHFPEMPEPFEPPEPPPGWGPG